MSEKMENAQDHSANARSASLEFDCDDEIDNTIALNAEEMSLDDFVKLISELCMDEAAKQKQFDEEERNELAQNAMERAAIDVWVKKFVEAARFGDVICANYLWTSRKPSSSIDVRDSDGLTAMQGAIDNDHLHIVRFLLKEGASVECKKSNGMTALQVAVSYEHLSIVRCLVNANADLEARCERNESTALHFAAENGSAEIASLLIKAGASVHATTSDGSFPLHIAAENGSTEVVALLINAGATVDAKTTDGSTPLLIAVLFGFLETVNHLLQAGARPSVKDCWGQSPLMRACEHGYLDIVKTLVKDNNMDLDVRDEDERTPLMWAADKGHLEIVKYLVDRGANVNAQDIEMVAPLALATTSKHVEIFKYLISSGASLECKTKEGVTIFSIAVRENCLEIVQYMVEVAGVDPNKPISSGATPLEWAIKESYHDMIHFLLGRCNHQQRLWHAAYTSDVDEVKLLVQDGVDVLTRGHECQSVLFTACLLGNAESAFAIVNSLKNSGQVDLVRQLLELPDIHGSTPLFAAVESGRLDAVEFIVSQGASVNSENIEGGSALTVAIRINRYDIVDYLIKNGRGIEGDLTISKALRVAASEGYDRIVRRLLETGVTTESYNASMTSPLMIACKRGHLQVAKTLIEHNAHIEARDARGFTPLMYAAEQGNIEIIQLLVGNRANVNAKGDLGETPLLLAVTEKHNLVSALLLFLKASVKCMNFTGHTPLHSFAARGQLHMVKLVIKLGADVNAVSIDGVSPSYIAASNGFSDVVDYLADHGACQETDSQNVWTIQSLRETYGCALSESLPRQWWYIDSSSIECPHLTEADFAGVLEGKWLGSEVTILKPCVTERSHVRQFVISLERWYPLNHPNILKLLGASHQKQLFFVAEQAENGNLRSYLKKNPNKTWKILHEVALALQYMHERNITHCGVQGSAILIGNDGSAKLAGMGTLDKSVLPTESVYWKAPEAVRENRVSELSDVYSLGMCIIEAATGDFPYSFEANHQKKDVNQLKKEGMLPRKPTSLSDYQWDLVVRMTREQSTQRLKMIDVVHELEMLRIEEECAVTIDAETPWGLDDYVVKPIANSLQEAQSICLEEEAHSSLESQLVARFSGLWEKISKDHVGKSLNGTDGYPDSLYGIANIQFLYPHAYAMCIPQQLLHKRFSDLVARFIQHLGVQQDCAARFAAERQREEAIYSLHSAMDWIVKLVQLRTSSTYEQDQWVRQWRIERKDRQQALSDELKRFSSVDAVDSPDTIESLTYLMFELTSHRKSYAFIDHRILRNALAQMRANSLIKVPQWFIPHYMIKISETMKNIGFGSYGSVHHAKWMDTHVVVKVLTNKADRSAASFENEVIIWFRLYHPHVIKLFGACHVGEKKAFVCEFAPNGELSKYMKTHRSELWQKLYEVALGILYLHERDIMHGDLKGDNLLVGADGRAKVADFGLSSGAVIPPNEAIRNGKIKLGVPRYRAPEALRGDEVTLKADVYAFAMCIVAMYTDKQPWEEEFCDDDIYKAIAKTDERMKPRKFPQKEWEMIESMCSLSPAERPDMPKVVEILDTLRRTCAVEPLEEPSGISHGNTTSITSSSNSSSDSIFKRSKKTSSSW